MNNSDFKIEISQLKQVFEDCYCVSLESEEICIYGWKSEGYKLNIEYFNGLATETQLLEMQNQINLHIDYLNNHFKDEEQGEEILDMYFHNGVKREDFY